VLAWWGAGVIDGNAFDEQIKYWRRETSSYFDNMDVNKYRHPRNIKKKDTPDLIDHLQSSGDLWTLWAEGSGTFFDYLVTKHHHGQFSPSIVSHKLPLSIRNDYNVWSITQPTVDEYQTSELLDLSYPPAFNDELEVSEETLSFPSLTDPVEGQAGCMVSEVRHQHFPVPQPCPK